MRPSEVPQSEPVASHCAIHTRPVVALRMAPRTLQSLAHALSSAPDLDAALVALGEGLAEVDRTAYVALLRYDGRREMIVDRLGDARVVRLKFRSALCSSGKAGR